jgi:hypothetical protein
VQDHAVGLRAAADLLGGPDHVAAVDEIVDRLKAEPVPSRRTLRLLDELLMLLSLELITDLESPEAAMFGLVDPADPVVAEICLLTDRLREVLAGFKAPTDGVVATVPPGRVAA